MTMELPEALYGTYADVTREVRKIYKAVRSGQDLATACGPLTSVDGHSGHIVITGPDRLSRDQALFRPHLLHDVASGQTGGRELQTWLVDPLLDLKWGGLCLVSQETKAICSDISRAHALLTWVLRWFDELEGLGAIFGDDRRFVREPTFCRCPTTLPMVVAAAGIPLSELQIAAFSSSSDMHALIVRAHANLTAQLTSP